MADWTQWRREAIDRTLEQFPPPNRITPRIENGTLVIVGGGGMPDGLMARFVEIAGGKEAKLVYVPCLEEDDATREAGMLDVWRGMGVQQCSMLHTKNRVQANEDDAFLEPLQSATGIWFGGGRQWNLADSYYGTKAHQLMLEVAISHIPVHEPAVFALAAPSQCPGSIPQSRTLSLARSSLDHLR